MNRFYHEELSHSYTKSGTDDVAQHTHALCIGKIPSTTTAFKQVAYFGACNEALSYFYSIDNERRPKFFCNHLSRLRVKLEKILVEDAEVLGSSSDNHRKAGWNRLILVWALLCKINVLLYDERDDFFTNIDALDTNCASLFSNQLAVSPTPCSSLIDASLSYLSMAMSVFCARIETLFRLDGAIYRYLMLLEMRCAHFVCNTEYVANKHFDVEFFCTEDEGGIARTKDSYMASTAWQFVWIKRYFLFYAKTTNARFFVRARAQQPGEYDSDLGANIIDYKKELADEYYECDDETRHACERSAYAFIERIARSMHLDQHLAEVKELLLKYDLFVADQDVHTLLFGIGGVERATIRDVLGANHSPVASTYKVFGKYKRPIHAWVQAFERRLKWANGAAVGGGAVCEALHENVIVLHVFDYVFQNRLHYKWANLHLIMHNTSRHEYMLNIKLAQLDTHLPSIVQRLGAFYVLYNVKLDDSTLDTDTSTCYSCVVVECENVLEAIIVWCKHMLEQHNGVLYGSVSCKKLIQEILYS